MSPKDLVNVKMNCGYSTNLDVFAGVFNNNADQHSTLEKLKTRNEMSRKSRAMTMDNAGSGRPRSATTASQRVQNSEPEVKAPNLRV